MALEDTREGRGLLRLTEDRQESLDRLRAAMAASPAAVEVAEEAGPAVFPWPTSNTCPDCGGRLCRFCARIYHLTAQHLRFDGVCPWGHRSAETKEN
jgi:hypothetical protein